ncbi:MAG: FAD-dependent monooxygenase [Acidobacteriaceae bacterium]|nr:FAD-dependent monooxygenase [Acidobacteriaceae bacterium]
MSSSYRKVCVVGGGPAGLAAAIALTREKCDVTIVDCGVAPMDKACGEGLMPDGLAALRELGMMIPEGVGFAFRGIRFADARSSICADFPNGMGRGVRRTTFHELLVRHAMNVGVSVIWNAKHARVVEKGVSFDCGFIEAQLVAGADGQNSQVRRQAALEQVARERQRYGFRRHYRIAPWSPYMELYWGTSSQIYVTPIASDEICVVGISRHPKLRLESALRTFPELYARLGNAAPASPEMGALSLSRRLRSVRSRNVILIGDASGSVDAITGEGMCLAFKQALALGRAVAAGDLRIYQRRHRELMRGPQAMASLILTLERNGRFQRRALAGLAETPEVFKALLAIHVGASSFRDLCSWRLLDLGRAFLAA